MVRLADGARIILGANPAHRLPDEGPAEAAQLARLINALADRHQSALGEVELRVHEANAKLEEERHRLAALMSELTDSVLVCNSEGLILLYNDTASSLFDRPADHEAKTSGIVGLGRSVFGVIDRDLIAHALDVVRERLHHGEARPVSQFVATAAGGGLLSARRWRRCCGARDRRQDAITGFVLTLDDVTGAVQGGEAARPAGAIADAKTRARGSRASAPPSKRSSTTATMEPARRNQFTAIILDEAVRLSERLDATLGIGAGGAPLLAARRDEGQRPAVATLQRSIARLPGVNATAETGGDTQWLKVDSFAVVQSFTALAARPEPRIRRRASSRSALSPGGRFTGLELTWQSPDTDHDGSCRLGRRTRSAR